MMKLHVSKIFHPVRPLVAVASGIAVLLSYLVGAYSTGHFHEESRWMGAMLAAISAIVVMQDDVRASVKMGGLRMLGTLIGVIIAYVYLVIFPFTLVGMVVTVFLLTVVCMWFGIPDNGRIATMTLVMILIVSKMSPSLSPLVNGALRFIEAALGSLIGIGLAWLVGRLQAKK